jgi:nucleoside-diphosphate-sugar epimerase
VFGGGDLEGGDESLPYPEHPESNYSGTKALAEQMVLKANSKKLRTVSVRPHLIWGPRDNHITPGIIEAGRTGRLPLISGGLKKVDTTYIDNCALAHLNAADALDSNPGCSGRAYFISNGEPRPLKDFLNWLLRAAGAPPIKRSIPKAVALAAATVMEVPYRVLPLKGEPRLNRFLVKEMSTAHWFHITAAKKELGYRPVVSIKEGQKRLKAWLSTTKI